MKRNILALLLLSASLVTFANARFFIGAEGGYSIGRVAALTDFRTDPVVSTTLNIDEVYTKDFLKTSGYMLGVNLGTQHYFDENEYVGLRWLLSAGYGRTNLDDGIQKLPSNDINVGFGIDILFDVIKFGNHSLGIFGGAEESILFVSTDATSTQQYKPTTDKLYEIATFSTRLRLGVSLFLAKHHRVEFITKIPIYDGGRDGGTEISAIDNHIMASYKPIQFMLGYKFVF